VISVAKALLKRERKRIRREKRTPWAVPPEAYKPMGIVGFRIVRRALDLFRTNNHFLRVIDKQWQDAFPPLPGSYTTEIRNRNLP
jgi:hypothetical protein